MIKNSRSIAQSLIRSNFSCFIHRAFLDLSLNDKYIDNWHIDKIVQKLTEVEQGMYNRLIINIPPRYLKSLSVNVAWPAWLLGHNPALRIISTSYSQALSNKHSIDSKLLINSDWYQNTFPQTKICFGENQKAKFVTTKRGFRFATSIGGTITGEGADILILDDPQNPSKINSKKYREKCIEWFEQTLLSRLNNKKTGIIVIVMQRLHQNDLCGYLLENHLSTWQLLKIPAIENNTPLHEQRENLADLNKLKTAMGSANFTAQYLQEPVPTNGLMVEKEWLQYFKHTPKDKFSKIIQSWDTAIKISNQHDFTVGITLGLKEQNIYILDIVRTKVEFPELFNLVQICAEKWRPASVVIEDSASGQSLIQSLKKHSFFPIITHKTKLDKISRFAIHTPLFESKRIFIPDDSSWKVEFEREILTFPKCTNDDQVDALSQGLNYIMENMQRQIRSF